MKKKNALYSPGHLGAVGNHANAPPAARDTTVLSFGTSVLASAASDYGAGEFTI